MKHQNVVTRDLHRQLLPCLACLLALSVVSNLQAQGLTYVDANDGFIGTANLSVAGGGALSTAIDSFGFDNLDNKWGFREFASGGTIFTASDADTGEDAPELIQTLSGLTVGNSYDVYVAYWSTTGNDWGVRAGFSSNPNGNQFFNRTGGFDDAPSAIAGTNASAAAWAQLPADNPTASDDGAGVFSEGNRRMLLGHVGNMTANSSGEIQVYIDDLPVSTATTGGAFPQNLRSWLDGLAYTDAGNDVFLKATIDRNTGQLTIANTTGSDFTVSGYSITSNAGSLAPSEWETISAGTNTGISDTDAWVISSQTSFSLAESEDPTNNGATLGSSGLPLSDVWIASPYEDIQIQLTLADSTVIDLTPEYTGTQQSFGDFDGVGGITVDDYEILLQNLHTDIAATTQIEAHMLGDITGDLTVDYADFSAFAAAYDAVNGVGSFALLPPLQVPEPSSATLLGLLGAVFALCYRKPLVRRAASAMALTGIAALACMVTSADAQTHVDAIGGVSGNTVNASTSSGTDWFVVGGNLRDDDLWGERGGFGIGGGQVYENWDPSGDHPDAQDDLSPDLVTTITGLTSGEIYRVWVDYIRFSANGGDPDGNRGGIEAGLNLEADMLLFGEATGSATTVGGSVLNGFTNADRAGLRGYLGTQVANESGEIDVFIGTGLPSGVNSERTWYDGVSFEEVLPGLRLEVDTTTGIVTLSNSASTAIDLSYYEIRSAAGSLDLSGWTTLDSTEGGDPIGEGWDVAGGSDSSILSEANLTSLLSVGSSDTISFGSAFSIGSAQDLEFLFAAPGEELQAAVVTYVTSSGLVGDYNADGTVDAADYTVWRANLGSSGDSLANRNPANTGVVSEDDFNSWRANYGASASSSTLRSVPEASSFFLVIIGCLFGLSRRLPISQA